MSHIPQHLRQRPCLCGVEREPSVFTPILDTTLEILVPRVGTWMALPSPSQPCAEEKGPLTMSTAAMGMAVFMKTVKEAQSEIRGGRRKEQEGGRLGCLLGATPERVPVAPSLAS